MSQSPVRSAVRLGLSAASVGRVSRRLGGVVVGVGLAALAEPARAQFTPIVEDFSTAGALAGSTPGSGVGTWTTISGSGGLNVSGGALSIAGASGQSAQLNFSSSDLSAGTVYLGFDYTVSSGGSIGTSDSVSGVAGFRSGAASGGSFALSFGDFRPSGAAQTFNGLAANSTSQVTAGIFTGSSLNATNTTLTAWSTPLTRGTTYRVVLGFDTAANTATLWIDPASTASTSVVLSAVAADPRGVFVREGAASHGAVTLDRWYASTSFETALAASAIPEPSTYAAFGGAAALAGAVWWRRRERRRGGG